MKFAIAFLIITLLILLFKDVFNVFILNNIIITRGILVPNCFWFNISDYVLNDSSGIKLFYKYKKKYGDIPFTYMFGEKTHIITLEKHIKEILDNSPHKYGPGVFKVDFFKSFMKDNVGVSSGCPWKNRRILNEKALDHNKLHRYAEKINVDTSDCIKKYLIKSKIDYHDFQKISRDMVGNIIFGTTEVHEDVFNIFGQANNVGLFYRDFKLITRKTKTNYLNYLKASIKNPRDQSLVKICVDNESSEHEIIHQIPHFIFPIAGLYLTSIPRFLLVIFNHEESLKKLIDEIKSVNIDGELNFKQIHNLTYLRKCVLELLRLNNPVTTTFRTVTKDMNLDSYKFKKGEQLLILNNPILRNPEYFKDQNKFIPERWNKDMESSYYAISFNQGPQSCPGKELTIFSIKSFIVNFFRIIGILKYGNSIIETEKINKDYIEQMINPCKIKFKVKNVEDFSSIYNCIGKKDGVSGCRDCCSHKNNYRLCVDKCMKY